MLLSYLPFLIATVFTLYHDVLLHIIACKCNNNNDNNNKPIKSLDQIVCLFPWTSAVLHLVRLLSPLHSKMAEIQLPSALTPSCDVIFFLFSHPPILTLSFCSKQMNVYLSSSTQMNVYLSTSAAADLSSLCLPHGHFVIYSGYTFFLIVHVNHLKVCINTKYSNIV